jgi:hypothetical protein
MKRVGETLAGDICVRSLVGGDDFMAVYFFPKLIVTYTLKMYSLPHVHHTSITCFQNKQMTDQL